MSVTMTAAATGQSSTGGNDAAQLDTSGHAHIGSVTITGMADTMTEVANYVDKLQQVKGVVVPYPANNAVAGLVVQYTIQLTLTDELYTHRFQTSSTGGN